MEYKQAFLITLELTLVNDVVVSHVRRRILASCKGLSLDGDLSCHIVSLVHSVAAYYDDLLLVSFTAWSSGCLTDATERESANRLPHA